MKKLTAFIVCVLAVGSSHGQNAAGISRQLNLGVNLRADHSYRGIVAADTCGDSLAFGDVTYLKSDFRRWKSDANSAATMPATAICVSVIGDSAGIANFLTYGRIRDDSWNWTAGAKLYASGTAGGLTATAPTGASIVQPVAIAMNADQILFFGGADSDSPADSAWVEINPDTIRTRYIRILDGSNSDSIASYIYFDGDTSRWAGDPIKIGNNSIIVKDDTVKISNAMLTVSGQVQADTLVPYHNSTIYIRHFTVDTIEIVKYFHQQEVALFDSLLYVAGDNDMLKFDASVAANVIDYEHDNVTVAKLDSAGNLTAQNLVAEKKLTVADSARIEGTLRQKGVATFGATATPAVITAGGDIGIGTTAPLFDLSIVNSNPATNNGVHVVDSNVNKNRSTYAQATDSASAMLSTIGGKGMLRLRGADGDSSTLYDNGTATYLSSKNAVYVQAGGTASMYMSASSVQPFQNMYPSNDDAMSLGATNNRWKVFNLSDNAYIGGKGQTAKLTIGTQNTMTEETDSCVVVTPVNGSGSVKLASAAGQIVTDMGVQPATYTATIGDMWLSRNGGTTPRDTLWIKVTADSSAYVVFGARELKH